MLHALRLCLILALSTTSGMAGAGELDGRSLLCDSDGTGRDLRLHTFEGDRVLSMYVAPAQRRDEELDVTVVVPTLRREDNIVSIMPTRIFWCHVANVDPLDPRPEGCNARDSQAIRSLPRDRRQAQGTWVEINRATLAMQTGMVLRGQSHDLARGSCRVIDRETAYWTREGMRSMGDRGNAEFRRAVDAAREATDRNQL